MPDNVDIHDEKALDRAKLRASQIIRMPLRCFSRGVFIGRDNDFVRKSVRSLARGYYSGTARLVRWCLKLDW